MKHKVLNFCSGQTEVIQTILVILLVGTKIPLHETADVHALTMP